MQEKSSRLKEGIMCIELSIPNMHPKMHCKVDGKLFAAVIDRQKTDISLTRRARFPGLILASGETFSEPAVPTCHKTKPQICKTVWHVI